MSLPNTITTLVNEPRLMPDTPLSEALSFLENSLPLTRVRELAKSRGRKLRIRCLWTVEGREEQELDPHFPWAIVLDIIGRHQAKLVVDDFGGGLGTRAPTPQLVI